MNERIESIKREICKVVVGKDRIVEKVMTAMIAGGHILLEDIPGVGKTTLALAFAGLWVLTLAVYSLLPT